MKTKFLFVFVFLLTIFIGGCAMNNTDKDYESLTMKEISSQSETFKKNDVVEFSIIPQNLTALKEEINSRYDYDEFKITIDIKSPSGKIDKIYAYYTQDFEEQKTLLDEMNIEEKIEGDVICRDNENYLLTLVQSGEEYYKAKYIPTEIGNYSYTMNSFYSNTRPVQTLKGNFNITGEKNSKGIIKVSQNNKTFAFEDGSTYAPVGENVCWYTSKERRYGDYELIFNSLAQNNANYARIWLSGFGFSLFWDDVENYDTRLDEAHELDKIFALAEKKGIYIDLTLFHHGMFSTQNNPMWPNTANTWYIDKYGANPYSEVFDNPSDFFTNEYALKWCKNYLTYICARYGYSNNLLCFDMFNEADWIDGYTSSAGNNWHDVMAKYLKNIDCKKHLITTSFASDNIQLSTFKVYNLVSIDFVNIHQYGSSNYLKVITQKALQVYSKFNKPIIYQEVGYSGMGGVEQMESDPNNITLHQELWAGLMGSGASGMNWWWDSWIEAGDCYNYYFAPGKFAKLMDLSGSLSLAYNNSHTSNSSSSVQTIGYLFANKAYLYTFEKNYSLNNPNRQFSSTITLSNMENGNYKIEYFDTFSGQIISTNYASTSNNILQISQEGTNDIALIISQC